jgi:ATP-dependent helicase/nuclease subunit B
MILTKSDEKSVDIDFEINRIIKSNQLERLLIIVPTNRKLRHLKKEIISLTPSKAASVINLETLGTYSTKLLSRNQKNEPNVLSEPASAVLLRQSFQEIKTSYFSNYSGDIPAGTLKRVGDVISEYKRQGITPEALKKESKNLKASEKRKAEDITAIYSVYQEKLNQLNLKEIGDVYSDLIKLTPIEFNDSFREVYPNVDLIIINGFDEFTTPEIEIIDLTSIVSNSRLFLSFDYYGYNPLIFSHLDKCYSKLEKKGFREIQELSQAGFNEFVSVVRENLFLRRKEKQTAFVKSIKCIAARNRETEVVLVAKEIKNLVTKENVEPHKICIVFNIIQEYSPIIRDLFPLYGLPYNLTDRFLLSNSSPVIALINFLEIEENDYYYKSIFRALSSGYLNTGGIDLSSLLKASVDLKVLSGYKRWISELQYAVSKQLDEDEDLAEKFSDNKAMYNKALSSLKKLHSYLKPFGEKLTVKEFRTSLLDLIFRLGISTNILNDNGAIVEKNIKALDTFIETIDEILDLLEEEYTPQKKFSLKFFLNQVRTAVASARYNIKEKPGYGVQITTLNEIRGLEFDYLFICSLCDGDLPTRYMPEIFLSGSYFRQEQNHQTEERYHFYQSLCSWKKGLYLTYPKSEERKELVQSSFLTEFKNLFEVTEKQETGYLEKIYSKEELLRVTGFVGVDSLKEKYNREQIPLDFDDVNRSILVNNLRTKDPYGTSAYVGDIYESLDNDNKDWLNNLKERRYSVSQLETYAKCPYKYFAERILNLKEIEEPVEEIEALEMGSVLHNILYDFYVQLRNKNIVLYNCAEEEFKETADLLFSIAEKKVEEANFKSPLSFYDREKILGINNDRKSSILYEFLNAERKEKEGFVPSFLEVAFGMKDKEDTTDAVRDLKVKGIAVRGKIDRIDINNEERTFRVIDYKLGGRKPTEEDLRTGISLQLPLYLFAARELIKAQLKKDFEPDGADIYSLRYREKYFGRLPVRSLSGESTGKIITERCLESIEKYVQAISIGKFHLTQLKDREDKVCRFCGFRAICRIEEIN